MLRFDSCLFLLIVLVNAVQSAAQENVAFFFETEPQGTWVKEGESATFSCSTTTNVEKTWVWKIHSGTGDGDSATVLDESSNTLVYGPATSADNGKFVTCSADVFGTKLISRYAIIRITYLDTVFLEQPDDVATKEGTDHVRLNCKAPAGNPEPYVTWLKNGEVVHAANTFVDPLGGLNILNVAASDAGTYTCTANSHQQFDPVLSRKATLTVSGSVAVSPLPVTYDVSFASARYKIVARVGDTVRVLCGFLGTPTPIFSIKSDDTALQDDTDSKAHGTWAMVQNIADVDEFKCEGTNKLGSQTLNIMVELKGALQVTGGVTKVSIIEDESTTLVCSETGAVDPTYSWYKNGEVISGESEKYLELTNAKRDQSGMYQCFAASQDAREHATFAVTVASTEADPVKVTVTSEEYGLLGSTHQISCVGQGNPVPSISWYRSKENSETAVALENVVYKETFTEMLAIVKTPVLTNEDNGVTYKCKGSNTHLYDDKIVYKAEASIDLIVVEPVAPIISLPSTSDFLAGSQITLICSVEGSPPPKIQWFKNGELIEGETSDVFVTNGDAGQYTCTATNILGSVSGFVNVKATSEYTGGQIFLIMLIVGVLVLFASVGVLIFARKNELARRISEAKAKDELLIEKEKKEATLPVAAYPYRVATPAEGGTDNPDLETGENVAVAEAECQTPRPILVSPTSVVSPQNVVGPPNVASLQHVVSPTS